jgi:hypothetical protein
MFGLSFLNSGILFLSSAVLIPLIIYLFAKKKPQKIIFSSIKFIKESTNQQKKKINLKNLLLLIIRMLIILFTVLAISRPTVKAKFLQNSTIHPKTAVALIIDNSYSMDYLSDTQTELEKAKQICLNVNELLNENDMTLLLSFNEDWNILNGNLGFGKFDEKLLQTISVTSVAAPLKDILKTAETKLKESHLPNREIYVLSDFQKQDLSENMETPVFFVPTSGTDERYNISCENSKVIRDFVNNSYRIEFEVKNHSGFSQPGVLCRLNSDGVTIAEKVIDLEANQRKKDYFLFNSQDEGFHSGFVSVKNERLGFDNKSFFSFNKLDNPKVAVVSKGKQLPLIMDTVLEIYSDNITSLNLAATNFEELITFDNLIFYNLPELDTKTEFTLNKLNNSGKKILVLSSEDMNQSVCNYFDIDAHKFNTENTYKTAINKFHRITSILDSKRNFVFIDFRHLVSSDYNSLIESDNYPIVAEKENILLWLFDIGSLNNSFLLDPAFPVLAYNSLQYTADNLTASEFITGNKYNFAGNNLELSDGTKTGNILDFIFEKPGIYKSDDIPFAVNLDYSESEFYRFESEKIKNITFLKDNLQKNFLQSRYGFEIWKYLLIFVLLLFITEMLLIKSEERK